MICYTLNGSNPSLSNNAGSGASPLQVLPSPHCTPNPSPSRLLSLPPPPSPSTSLPPSLPPSLSSFLSLPPLPFIPPYAINSPSLERRSRDFVFFNARFFLAQVNLASPCALKAVAFVNGRPRSRALAPHCRFLSRRWREGSRAGGGPPGAFASAVQVWPQIFRRGEDGGEQKTGSPLWGSVLLRAEG